LDRVYKKKADPGQLDMPSQLTFLTRVNSARQGKSAFLIKLLQPGSKNLKTHACSHSFIFILLFSRHNPVKNQLACFFE